MNFDELQALAVEWYSCDFCGVAYGTWCVTRRTGAKAKYVHMVRVYPIQTAYAAGFREGVEEGVADARRRNVRSQGASVA